MKPKYQARKKTVAGQHEPPPPCSTSSRNSGERSAATQSTRVGAPPPASPRARRAAGASASVIAPPFGSLAIPGGRKCRRSLAGWPLRGAAYYPRRRGVFGKGRCNRRTATGRWQSLSMQHVAAAGQERRSDTSVAARAAVTAKRAGRRHRSGARARDSTSGSGSRRRSRELETRATRDPRGGAPVREGARRLARISQPADRA